MAMAFRSGRGFALLHKNMQGCKIHGAGASLVDETRGSGPVRGPENDPATKGSTPDDGRADDVHMAEPKEVTKQKVAKAQQEPEGLQGEKLMAGFDAPINKDAKPQHTTIDHGAKYHTYAMYVDKHRSLFTSSPSSHLQVTPQKTDADRSKVKLKDGLMTWETQDGSTTWVWWKASATFPGHFGVFQAKPEDTKVMSS